MQAARRTRAAGASCRAPDAALRILTALNSDLPAAGFLNVLGRTLCEATGCKCLVTEADAEGRLVVQWPANGREQLPAEAQLPATGAKPRYGRYHGGHFASLPLVVSGRLAGGLHLLGAGPFSPSRRRWLEFIAGAVSRWLARNAQVHLLAQHAADMEIALQSGAARPGMDRLLTGALRNMADTLQADSCSLMLADRESGDLLVDTAYGLSETATAGSRPGEGIASYVLRTGEPLLLNDPRHDPRLAGLSFIPRPGIGSSICVPIHVGGAVEGVVSLNRSKSKGRRPFSESDLRLAVGLAGQLAPCVENAILYQRSAGMLREMSAVSQAACAAATARRLAEVCRLVARGAAELSGAPCAVLLARDGKLVPGYPAEAQPSPQAYAALAGGRRQREAECSALPILAGGQVVGVLQVTCPGGLQNGQARLLSRFLQGVAPSLQHAAAYESLSSHLAELNLVQQALQRMSASLQPEAVLAALAEAGKGLAGTQRALLALDAQAWSPRPSLRLPRHCRLHWLTPDSAAAQVLAGVSGAALLQTAAHPPLLTLLEDWHASEALVARLMADGRSLGAVVYPVTTPLPQARLQAVHLLAQHAGAIVKQALDYREAALQQSLEVSALYRLCEQISGATDFASALSSALDIIGSMVDFDQAAIYLWEGEGSRLRLIAARGMESGAVDPAERDICHWVARESKAFLSSRALESPGQVSSLVAVPLVIEQHCLGVLSVRAHARSRPYSEDQVKLLSIVGSQAAAIYRAIQKLGTLSRYTDNILESMLAGVIGLDNEGKVVMWSPAAERILGYPASRTTGRTLDAVIDEVARRRGAAAAGIPLLVRRVTATGEAVAGHAVRLKGQEGSRYLTISCSPLRDDSGAPMGSVLLIEDVTERQEMEERVASMDQLATVGRLAANVAHEIRNPISAIKTAAQFLRKEYQGEGLIDQFAGIINEECDRLSKVTSDFLSFARPSTLSMQPTSIAGVLDRTLQLVGPHLDEQGIRLEQHIDHLPDLNADRDELVQVFLNLLLNAVQAIDGPGTITITARPHGEGGVQVEVADTGCGIPPEALEEVFKPFYSTKTKGTGLGLAIVRKIVEAHGGTVEITSKVRRGTTCRVLLPGPGQQAVVAAAAPPQEPDLAWALTAAGQLQLFPGD